MSKEIKRKKITYLFMPFHRKTFLENKFFLKTHDLYFSIRTLNFQGEYMTDYMFI